MKNIHKINQNIYITSDEEIKEGDYRYSLIQNNFELVSEFSLKVNKEYWKLNNHIYKKVVLTTDQDLIKDGVQAIDNEFLEWFINNPSCDSVDVESMFNMVQFTSREFIHKIIIPKEENYERINQPISLSEVDKEEPKQERMYSNEDMIKFISFVGKNYIKAKGFYYMKGDFEKKHKVSIHQILEQFKNK